MSLRACFTRLLALFGWRRNPDFVDTVPVMRNPVQRPLHSAKVPPPLPVVRNLSNVPIHVLRDRRKLALPPEDKDCCGACDGSRCGASTASRREDPADEPYRGSYYGQAVSQVLTAPRPEGRGFPLR